MSVSLPDYDVVIATRNRASVLPISIPTLLGQSVPPRRLIVVDSSDDHQQVKHAVESATARFNVPWQVHASERGGPRQRNRGLEFVESPIVFFPDDDSLWHPGAAEAILRVYARDRAGRIGGVAAAQASTPPPAVLENISQTPYALRWTDRLKNRLSPVRARIEHALFPDPFILHGRDRIEQLPVPAWLEDEGALPVEWMTGFRMTFRADAVRATRFDETFINYSVFDDIELCFHVMRNWLIVGANRAQVYHYRDPRARGHAGNMGLRQILDRAYIIAKHTDDQSRARRRLVFYSWYKLLQYTLSAMGREGRSRAMGALRGVKQIREILHASPDHLREIYLRHSAV